MDIITTFLQKHNILPNCEEYTQQDIDAIVRVINGDFTEIEKNKFAMNFAGICVEKKLHLQSATKTSLEYYEMADKMGCSVASFNVGNYYFRNCQYDNALTHYIKYYKITNLSNGAMMIGLCYFHKNKYDFAKKYLFIAHDGKKTYQTYYTIGCTYFKEGRYEDVEEYAQESLQLKNDFSAVYDLLAKCYDEQKRYVLAEKYYLLAIEHGFTQSIYDIAVFYEKLNQIENAEKYYLTAIDNNITGASKSLAKLYADQQRYKLAKKYYDISVKKDANSIVSLHKIEGQLQFHESQDENCKKLIDPLFDKPTKKPNSIYNTFMNFISTLQGIKKQNTTDAEMQPLMEDKTL